MKTLATVLTVIAMVLVGCGSGAGPDPFYRDVPDVPNSGPQPQPDPDPNPDPNLDYEICEGVIVELWLDYNFPEDVIMVQTMPGGLDVEDAPISGWGDIGRSYPPAMERGSFDYFLADAACYLDDSVYLSVWLQGVSSGTIYYVGSRGWWDGSYLVIELYETDILGLQDPGQAPEGLWYDPPFELGS